MATIAVVIAEYEWFYMEHLVRSWEFHVAVAIDIAKTKLGWAFGWILYLISLFKTEI